MPYGGRCVGICMLRLQGGDFRSAVHRPLRPCFFFSRRGSGRGSDRGMAVTPIAIAIANTDWDGGRRETRQGQPGHPEEDFRPSLDNTLVPCRAGRRHPRRGSLCDAVGTFFSFGPAQETGPMITRGRRKGSARLGSAAAWSSLEMLTREGTVTSSLDWLHVAQPRSKSYQRVSNRA